MNHMFRSVATLVLFFFSSSAISQHPFTVNEYNNPRAANPAAWKTVTGMQVSFASADVRYAKEKVPTLVKNINWKTKAWKGEKVHTKILLWGSRGNANVSFTKSPLIDEKGNQVPADQVSVDFIRYVMTDTLGRNGSGCGIPADLDSSLVEDLIDNVKSLPVMPNSAQPAWLSVSIPQSVPAGNYKGSVVVNIAEAKPVTLNYEIEVLNRVLPAPKDWRFHLDLWQNPFSVSRVHGVEDWSAEHMQLMEPYMKMLANAGQKVITTSIIYDPWNSQTFDIYKSMVKWVKKADGSWSFDYTIFDKWVSYMMALGIDKEINCYSMIPWNLKFYYYDEASGRDTLIIAKPGTTEYEQHWTEMLRNFAGHLKEKGWFAKTTIAMDERPMEHMQFALAIIRKADKDFRVSMAGDYHKEIEAGLFDYCVASKFILPQEVLERRKKDGFVTTFYTACPEAFPNTFSFSPPAEAAFMGWYAAARGFDGYLRWAYNSWPEKPLQDSRFRKWSAGDTYFIYPGNRSSVRFERLIEGIQAYEKVRILSAEFEKANQQDKIKRLQAALANFQITDPKKVGAAAVVNSATSVVNNF